MFANWILLIVDGCPRTEVKSSVVPPVLRVLSVYPGVDTIDVMLSLDQEGRVQCIAVETNDTVPEASDFRNMIKANGNNTYVSITNLENDHEYAVYCYAENDYDLPSETEIASTKQVTHTFALDSSPVLIIESIEPQRESVTVGVVSTDAGTAYCLIRDGVGDAAYRLQIKNEGQSQPIRSYETLEFSFNDLSPSTTYSVYCTAESNGGIPMRSAVERVVRQFSTLEPERSALVLVICIIAVILCVLLSAFFSSLSLGLMGLDLMSLQVIADMNIEEIGDNIDPRELADLKKDKAAAQKIFPIRKKGNLLACTLLIGNVMVNSIISILIADMTNGYIGFLISICIITAFGEIIPKAYGSRYALQIGAFSSGLVQVFIVILYIICKPIAMLLDHNLGDDLGNVYNRYQLYTMLEMKKERNTIHKDAANTMQEALTMDTTAIIQYMHPLESVYMIPDTTLLDYGTCLDIFRRGHSHIPVFHDDRQNIVGVLHMKELIMVDPNQCVSVQSIMKLFPGSILVINSNQSVSDSIRDMVNSHTKLAFISRTIENIDKDNTMEIAGIVTLEDCIKAVMRLDFIDEMSAIEARNTNSDLLNMFNSLALSSLDATTLDILGCFINQALGNQGYHLPDDVIRNLVREGSLEKVTTNDPPIYEVGKPCTFATIVMKGVFTMIVGEDRMVAEKPIFSVINLSCLLEDNFV